jgi:hypothetical protein
VANIKYLAATETNQSYIREEIKSRLNFAKAYHHSVQNHPVYLKTRTEIYKTRDAEEQRTGEEE